jgi:polysaccharide chain length determinant protein (PEP-CTERM system associated)
MLGHRELTIEDYAEIVRRRFWLIFVCTLLTLALGVALTFVLPPQFVSQTLVLIEQQKVPDNYVKPIVNEDIGARLASLKEQILSRSRLEPIIDRFNLYTTNRATMDDRIDMTRKAIGIKTIPSSGETHGMPGFFISFKASDAHTAQLVCSEITNLFVATNLDAQSQSAEGTTDFLKQQLAESKAKLDEQDAKLAAFQRKYSGKLPEQEGSNSNTLNALSSQLDASTQNMNRLQQNKTFLEAMIAQQSQDQSHNDPVSVATDDTLKMQLKEAINQEKALEAIYTPDHPDVVAAKRKIANIQADMARGSSSPAKPGSAPASHAESPQLQQLRAQLRSEQQAITQAKQSQSQLESQIRNYEGRIESTPAVEEEYKQITRDHETALQFYNTLLTKMNESSMATALQQRQQGEQFRVMDAANLPDGPVFPNRLIFAGGGFALGLMIGLGLAALLEYRDTSLRNERDIWAFTKLPTLAVIAHINGLPQRAAEHTKSRWRFFARTPKPLESAGN